MKRPSPKLHPTYSNPYGYLHLSSTCALGNLACIDSVRLHLLRHRYRRPYAFQQSSIVILRCAIQPTLRYVTSCARIQRVRRFYTARAITFHGLLRPPGLTAIQRQRELIFNGFASATSTSAVRQLHENSDQQAHPSDPRCRPTSTFKQGPSNLMFIRVREFSELLAVRPPSILFVYVERISNF